MDQLTIALAGNPNSGKTTAFNSLTGSHQHVGNYPGMPEGVQANLYLCGDTLIGGDIIATGKGGFQRELAYPKG